MILCALLLRRRSLLGPGAGGIALIACLLLAGVPGALKRKRDAAGGGGGISVALAQQQPPQPQTVIVDTEYGKVQGLRMQVNATARDQFTETLVGKPANVFLGIMYAKPPVRFEVCALSAYEY